MRAILKNVGLYDFAVRVYFFGKKLKNVYSPLGRWRRIKYAREEELPLPSPELMYTVAGTSEVKWFLESGRHGGESVLEILGRNNIPLNASTKILDLGCGCGRVLRHLKSLTNAQLYGTDYNAKLIEWCKSSLPLAHFETNELTPPLRYSDGTFDLVYAFSVFTHLPEHLQLSWMNELRRVIREGGHLLITTHGEHYLEELVPADQEQFQRGQLVVLSGDDAGSNRCAVFHPEEYVRTRLAEGFEVIDFIPEGAKGNPMQDAILLKRKSTGTHEA